MRIRRRTSRCGRRGFSILEATMCSVVVASLGAAALHVVGIAAKAGLSSERRAVGSVLAGELLAEIMAMPFDLNGEFGPVELKGGGRVGMEDVNDYHGYKASPPTDRDGAPFERLDNYTIAVDVEHVDPVKPSVVTGGPTGVVRISVRVEYQQQRVGLAVGLRSVAADQLGED